MRFLVDFIPHFIAHFIKCPAFDERFNFIAFDGNAAQKIFERAKRPGFFAGANDSGDGFDA